MNKKLIWIIAVFLLASAIFTIQVSAIGITPGRTVLEFEPHIQKEIKFSVVNTEHKDMKVLLKLESDDKLDKYVTLSSQFVEFKADEYMKNFKDKLDIPGSALGRPGDHEVSIIAQELAEASDAKGTYVGVSLAVASQLVIRVPFPGKHVSFKFEIDEQPGEVKFILPVFNLGDEKIEKAKASIEVQGPDNKPIAKLFTTEESIDAKGRKELISKWDTSSINPGLYYAVVILDYDGKLETYETTFTLGDPIVEITDVKVRNFQLGDVAKFEITVESRWQEMIDDLYAELLIQNDKNVFISESKSATTQLAPNSNEVIEAFWDTKDQQSGFYKAVIVLHYKGKVKETKVDLEVTLNQIKTSLVSATAEVVSGKEGILKRNSAIMIAVVVLVVLNIIWFRYLKRRKIEEKI